MKTEELKDMTDKELIQEWRDIDFHIRNLGVGRWEINHITEVEQELTKRDVMY